MADPEETAEGPRADLAAAFDGSIDPLAAHAGTFDHIKVDPFEVFRTEVLAEQDPAASTRNKYGRLFRQWRTHMARQDRHPACPNGGHVRAFVESLQTERGNQPDTARTKLRRLAKVYRYWQQDPAFPHPQEYNPFELVLSKLNLSRPAVTEPPRIPIDELAAILQSVTDVRDRAIIGTQLKLGLRASEVSNLRLGDLHIEDQSVQRGYPDLGSHDRLDRRRNAVYVRSRYERNKNKSRRARILPLDADLRNILRQYLLVRPQTEADSVFLTATTHNPLSAEYINEVWTDHFHPAYTETDEHRAVTSHYGRHRFTTYWEVKEGLARELVQYLRGDTVAGDQPQRDAVDDYIHTYYEDIEDCYRDRIFALGL